MSTTGGLGCLLHLTVICALGIRPTGQPRSGTFPAPVFTSVNNALLRTEAWHSTHAFFSLRSIRKHIFLPEVEGEVECLAARAWHTQQMVAIITAIQNMISSHYRVIAGLLTELSVAPRLPAISPPPDAIFFFLWWPILQILTEYITSYPKKHFIVIFATERVHVTKIKCDAGENCCP